MESTEIDWSRFDAEEVVKRVEQRRKGKRLGEISMIMELQEK